MNTEVSKPNNALNNDDLNESDSEFLSALEQVFITSSSIGNELDAKPQQAAPPTTDTPRIETLLHTPSIKQTVAPIIDQKISTEASSTPNNSPKNTYHKLDTKYTIALWLATGSLIIAGIAIWQLNELYEHIFRLETMNKTLESQLLETLTRIDLVKNNFTRVETILHQLESSSAITTSITPTEP